MAPTQRKGHKGTRIGRFELSTPDRASDRILREAFWMSPASHGPATVIALSASRTARTSTLR